MALAEDLKYQLRWLPKTPPDADSDLVAVQDRGFNALQVSAPPEAQTSKACRRLDAPVQETRAFLGADGTCEASRFEVTAACPHGELQLAFRNEFGDSSSPLIQKLRIDW